MSIEDRDWYREAYKEKEEKYGGDFSLNGKRQKAADAMWEEVEPSHSGGGTPPKNPTTTKTAANPSDDDYVLIAGGCTKCGASFNVRVKRKELGNYTYACPKCGQKMTVKSQTVADTQKAEGSKNLFIVATSFYGAFIALWLTSKTMTAWPLIIVMLIYNIWMLITIFTKKPKTGIGTKILAIFFFIFSEGIMGFMAYSLYQKFLL